MTKRRGLKRGLGGRFGCLGLALPLCRRLRIHMLVVVLRSTFLLRGLVTVRCRVLLLVP